MKKHKVKTSDLKENPDEKEPSKIDTLNSIQTY
jgi:hypothetical protein